MEELDVEKILSKKDEIDESLYVDMEHVTEGIITTHVGSIKRVKTTLERKDILQNWHARWNIKRNSFRIKTGLYAVGNPNSQSEVLVTANYKLTFDELRKRLHGLDVWILVLDTKGINVWCAAGKGTFGTEELIRRILITRLKELVSHNRLIVPQLGAPGILAHTVKKYTGFQIKYGPIRSEDIKEYLDNGYTTTEEMRRVKFTFRSRIVLTPVELLISLKYIPIFLLFFMLLNIISLDSFSVIDVLYISIFNSLPYLIALIIGSFLVPILLPYIPFRPLALKGAVLGILWAISTAYFHDMFMFSSHLLVKIGNGLILTSLVSFLSLNFTGSTTYTSFSGVKKETIITIPMVILASIIGVILIVISYL